MLRTSGCGGDYNRGYLFPENDVHKSRGSRGSLHANLLSESSLQVNIELLTRHSDLSHLQSILDSQA